MNPETHEQIDIREIARTAGGETVASDRRLFMQFFAYGGCADSAALIDTLADAEVQGVLYEDLNDPYGVALLTFSEEPDYFLGDLRSLLKRSPFSSLTPKPEHTMFGRTYAVGYEADLVEALISRPINAYLTPNCPGQSGIRCAALAHLSNYRRKSKA